MSTQQTNRPVHTVRFGSVKASIWQNETRFGPMYNVTVVRSYKDFDQWKDSPSFGFDELLVLAKAVDECHSWIHSKMLSNAQTPNPASA